MGLREFKIYEGTKNWYSQEGKWGIGIKKKTKKYTWSVFHDNKKVATGSGFNHIIEACDVALARVEELRRKHEKKSKKSSKTTGKRKRTRTNNVVSTHTS